MGERIELSRRQFLGGAAGGTAAFLLSQGLWRPSPAEAGAVPTHTVWLRRPDDQMLLRVETFGLELDARRSILVRSMDPAHIVVHFPPQHIHEQTYQEVHGVVDPPTVPTPVRLAGESRLAFRVPAGVDEVPFTADSLLDWSMFDLAVVPAAVPPGQEPSATNLIVPQATHTAVEMPWQLLLSPVAGATFTHPAGPVTLNGRTELWRTRLDGPSAPIRAVMTKDDGAVNIARGTMQPSELSSSGNDHPFEASLSPLKRAEVMLSTTDYGATDFTPKPIMADRLMLSAFGGDLRSAGDWSPYSRSSLMRWAHRMSLGRDLNVEVIRAGWLFPTGHPVTVIEITERKFVAVASTKPPMTPLVRRTFLVVGDKVRTYGGAEDPNAFHPDQGRRFPFTEVRLITEGTSDLDAPDPDYQPPGVNPDNARSLTVNGAPFVFQAVGTDRVGRDVPFSFSGWFVSHTQAFDAAGDTLQRLVAFQQSLPVHDAIRQGQVDGATVALAPSKEAGDTDVELHRIGFGADLARAAESDLRPAGQPAFFPAADLLMVRLRGSDIATGSASGELVAFGYDTDYVQDGFEPDGSQGRNPAHVFCTARPQDMPTPPRTVDLSGDRTGLVHTSNLDTGALSRTMGEIVGHFEDFANNVGEAVKKTFDPREWLKAELARILGRFSIADLLEEVVHVAGLTNPAAPTITFREERDEFGLPTLLITDLDWRPVLKPFPAQASVFIPGSDASLVIQGHFETDLRAPGTSYNQLDGVMRDVTLSLFGDQAPTHLLDIPIRRLEFHDRTGSKTTLIVDLGKIEFYGVMRYIGQLADFLSRDGDGPWVEVSSNMISAGIDAPLPAIEVGVFAISNLTVWNQIDLPFDNRPVHFQFGVSRRDDPALLTVSMFGGGFYFQTRASADGLLELETSIMFGASAVLDLGVASGAAGMFGGIILRLGYDDEAEKDVAHLEGFFQAFGYLNVLMLIVMSIELYLGLGYDFESNKAYGRASITFSISIVLFSVSVSVDVERRFGGESDPTFDELMKEDDWDTYCAAFA